MQLEVTLFTDPACPFAFSAEPARFRLRWHYREQLVLANADDRADPRTRAKLEETRRGRAHAAAPLRDADRPRALPQAGLLRKSSPAAPSSPRASTNLGRRGAPAPAAPRANDGRRLTRRSRPESRRRLGVTSASTQPCSPSGAEIDAAHIALEADMRRRRAPSAAARALDHKLGRTARRAPLHPHRATSSDRSTDGHPLVTVPGFNPVEVYETAIANLAPTLERRAKPTSAEEVLEWAASPWPPRRSPRSCSGASRPLTRSCSKSRDRKPSAADFYWTLDPRESSA